MERLGENPRSRPDNCDYLTSTFAPASSSFFLAASESALFAPSSTGFGAPSTSALASAKPRPALISRTALIAAIFLSAGAETRITSNVSFAAAAGAAPPAAAPPAAATATGAAALTPHLVSSCFTKSAASKTVNLLNSSTMFAMSAILLFFLSSRRPPKLRRISVHSLQTDDLRCCCLLIRFAKTKRKLLFGFLRFRLDHLRQLRRGRIDQDRQLRRRSNEQAQIFARKTSRLGKSASAMIPTSSKRELFKKPNLIFSLSNSAAKFFNAFAAAEMSFCPVTTAICPASEPFNSATPASFAAIRKMEFFTT